MHRPIPPRARDLRQALRVVLVGLVHLHLERRAGVPRVETDAVEPLASQLVHKLWRHGAGPYANPGVLSHTPLSHARSALDPGRTRRATACDRSRPRRRSPSASVTRPNQRTVSLSRLPCANRRATAPGLQHHGRPMPQPRLPNVHKRFRDRVGAEPTRPCADQAMRRDGLCGSDRCRMGTAPGRSVRGGTSKAEGACNPHRVLYTGTSAWLRSGTTSALPCCFSGRLPASRRRTT